MALVDRLDAYLDAEDLAAVWFARPNSFAWLTEGGDNVIERTAPGGIAAVGYDGDALAVVTDSIEAPRLEDEELPDDIEVIDFPWYESSLAETLPKVSPQPAAADIDVPGFERVDASPLRQPLTESQIERYERLGADVAAGLESVMRETAAENTELEVTGRIRGELEAQGIATPVVLVGSADRLSRYRHYTPQDVPLGEYAIASVTAERDGLHLSLSRTVAFDPPDWLGERTHDAMRVEATALAATREVAAEGGTASDVFAAIQDAYATVGWEGEWRHHHQGGAAGFTGREWLATPESSAPVTAPMAYAWNPTIQGAKSEDTHVVGSDGVRTLSVTGEWPTTTVESVDGDLELQRHDVLEL